MWGNYIENKLAETDKKGKPRHKLEDLLRTVDNTQKPVPTAVIEQRASNYIGLVQVIEVKNKNG